jgi:hypothetical protein
MHRLAAYLLVVFCASFVLSQTDTGMKSLSHALSSGGKVNLQLESGSYVVQPSDREYVVIRWDPDGDVRVNLNVKDGSATVSVANTPHKGNFHAEIELPRRTDLWIRLTAGDLDIGPLRGGKDIELRAGNLNISIPDPQDYSHVDASLYAGDLNASAFGIQKDGLFRSFDWHGSGQYRLHAHLMAGDLTMRSSGPN